MTRSTPSTILAPLALPPLLAVAGCASATTVPQPPIAVFAASDGSIHRGIDRAAALDMDARHDLACRDAPIRTRVMRVASDAEVTVAEGCGKRATYHAACGAPDEVPVPTSAEARASLRSPVCFYMLLSLEDPSGNAPR